VIKIILRKRIKSRSSKYIQWMKAKTGGKKYSYSLSCGFCVGTMCPLRIHTHSFPWFQSLNLIQLLFNESLQNAKGPIMDHHRTSAKNITSDLYCYIFYMLPINLYYLKMSMHFKIMKHKIKSITMNWSL
jgi:hypothetical protein